MRRHVVLAAVAVALFVGAGEFQEYLQVNQRTERKSNSTAASMQAIPNTFRTVAATNGAASAELSALDLANNFLEAHRTEWMLQPYHEFRPVEFRTPLSTKVKYSVFQEGIPVLNMDISIEISNDKSIGHVENRYVPIEKAGISKKSTKVSELLPVVSDRYKVAEDLTTVAPPVIVVLPGTKIPQIAYQLSVTDKTKANAPVEILFRASDGQILGKTRPRSEF